MENKSIRVLVVDHNLTMLWGLSKLIQGEFPRMTLVGTASTAAEALVLARLHPHVILLEPDLDGRSSLEIIPTIRQRSGGQILIHTLRSHWRDEDPLRRGAMGIVFKGEPADTLLQAIENIARGETWQQP